MKILAELVFVTNILFVRLKLTIPEHELEHLTLEQLLEEADLIETKEESSACVWDKAVLKTYEVDVLMNDGRIEKQDFVYRQSVRDIENVPFHDTTENISFTLQFQPHLNCLTQDDPQLVKALQEFYLYSPSSGTFELRSYKCAMCDIHFNVQEFLRD